VERDRAAARREGDEHGARRAAGADPLDWIYQSWAYDAHDVGTTPGFGGEAVKFLTEQRDIVGVGVDTLSLDLGTSAAPVAHLTVLGAGKYGANTNTQ
jgi:kynurenine formamidase